MKPIHSHDFTSGSRQAVPRLEHTGILCISAQSAINPVTGKAPAGGIREQAEQALRNLENELQTNFLHKHDVIMCKVYTPDVAYWPALNEVYAQFFEGHQPARVVVPTNQLSSNSLVEVEAIVALKEKG
ncbi:RidA family protein [Bacillus sp. NPDC077027]|uniref:RidA family protein n=1 Tax=Bacillus sp. NPDC077027 TaxID=3390548 RepID=UPI003D075A43